MLDLSVLVATVEDLVYSIVIRSQMVGNDGFGSWGIAGTVLEKGFGILCASGSGHMRTDKESRFFVNRIPMPMLFSLPSFPFLRCLSVSGV